MKIQCNKFETTPTSCRFYAFPDEGGERVKVHVDGKVDFKKVASMFNAKGVAVTETALKEAHKE